MKEPGLDNRHRDKNGEISRKHGNTLVRTLRGIYGSGFASGFPQGAKLSGVLHRLDEPSLSQLPAITTAGIWSERLPNTSERFLLVTIVGVAAV
jgi:hypothetical protein